MRDAEAPRGILAIPAGKEDSELTQRHCTGEGCAVRLGWTVLMPCERAVIAMPGRSASRACGRSWNSI